jgi:hypothetical protein
MASGANPANARVPTAPPGIRNLVSAKTAELSKMWRRGTGQITWPDFRVFAPNPTLQRPPRLANLAPDAFKAFGSVVAFWAPHMFWRWVRVACPRCGRADTVAAQGWSKIRRVMGLVPHYLVGYRYRCIACPGRRLGKGATGLTWRPAVPRSASPCTLTSYPLTPCQCANHSLHGRRQAQKL